MIVVVKVAEASELASSYLKVTALAQDYVL